MVGYDFDGTAWSLTTTGGSRDVSSSDFRDAKVIGGTYASTTAQSLWTDCEFADGVSVAAATMAHCEFAGTLTLNAAGNYYFIDCSSVVAGTGTPVFAIPAGTVNVSFRRWSGGIRITGITSATVISIDMVSGSTVTLEGADGNVQVRGMTAGITDSRTGTPTLGQNAAINMSKINTECDTALTDYDGPTNAELATALGTADDAVLAVLGTPAGASLAADVAAVKVDTAAILVDTGTTLDGKIDTIDTVVDGIKAKTDSLTFTKALEVDANVQSINGTTIVGDGVAPKFGV